MISRAFGFMVVAVSLLAAAEARADKIDGSWCREDGAHLSIDGSSILTPGGASISGDYRRHFFRFVMPPSEPGAGSTVDLALLNENTVQGRVGSGPPVMWIRCAPPVSLLRWSGGIG